MKVKCEIEIDVNGQIIISILEDRTELLRSYSGTCSSDIKELVQSVAAHERDHLESIQDRFK